MSIGPGGGLSIGPGGGLSIAPGGGLHMGPTGGLWAGPDGTYTSNIPPWDVFIEELETRGMTDIVELLRSHGL